ncbi:MAG: hypothetical protein ACYSTR_02900 [Planctomycetota bacterium]|jgi:hypothetical protein
MAKWNEKWTMLWGFYLLEIVFLGLLLISIFMFSFMFNHPILFWVMVGVLFLIGLVIVWKRAGKKDKQE